MAVGAGIDGWSRPLQGLSHCPPTNRRMLRGEGGVLRRRRIHEISMCLEVGCRNRSARQPTLSQVSRVSLCGTARALSFSWRSRCCSDKLALPRHSCEAARLPDTNPDIPPFSVFHPMPEPRLNSESEPRRSPRSTLFEAPPRPGKKRVPEQLLSKSRSFSN